MMDFRKGFTLLELLVVVTIIVILTGAALPYVQQYVDDSRYSKAKADLDLIKGALALYETKRGEPYNLVNRAFLTGPQTTGVLIDRGYLTKNPVDPWGAPYQIYGASGTVVCKGPDGIAVTSDDIEVPFQPPLSCTAAYWVDGNQDSQVTLNGPDGDFIILNFTRSVKSPFPGGNADNSLNLVIDNVAEVVISNPSGVPVQPDRFDWYNSTGKQGKIWWVGGSPDFTPGQSTVNITSSNLKNVVLATDFTLRDFNDQPCKDDGIKIFAR